MKETVIHEKLGIKLRKPILIEGLPGLGSVGKIVVKYLVRQLRAQAFAYLYSPHFPYHVIVDKKGGVRLLRGSFYYWSAGGLGGRDLILLTGDSQAQTIEGQYEVATHILDFAEKHGVRTIITVGGYSAPAQEMEPRVIGVATSPKLLDKLRAVGVDVGSAGSPIVGTAGLLVGFSKFKKIEAICLLGETAGYMPDPKAAKSVLKALVKILEIKLDFSELDKAIERAGAVLRKMEEVERKMELYEKTLRRVEKEKTTYIS